MAARDLLHDDRASRPAILAVVVGMHLAALLIPLLAPQRPDGPNFHGPGYLSLVVEEPPPLRLPPQPEIVTPKGIHISPPQPAFAPLAFPNEAASTASVMAPPDWKQSGADAAADAARKEYRALGPRADEPKIKMPRSPFKQPPEHKYGDAGEDVLENPVAWLSNNCYVMLENRKAKPEDPLANIPMTLCKYRGRKARGDLFDHLRKPQLLP